MFYVVFCSTSGNTLYEVLEISQTATADEIKRAYRKVSIFTMRTVFVFSKVHIWIKWKLFNQTTEVCVCRCRFSIV